MEKRSHPLTRPNISRFDVEETVRASYANRKYSNLGKLSVAVPAKVPPPVVINDPHALDVGGGLRGGGTGDQRQSRGGSGGGGRGQQQGGRGQQQQWSQGWNEQLPSHGGEQMGTNCSISSSRCGSNRSSSSSSSNMFIDSSNRINSNTFGNSSSSYSLDIPLILHRPNGRSGGHLIVVLTLLGGTKRSRHPRPTLRCAACTSASDAEDSGIWPRSVPFHSGSKVHATVVVSMATATTAASLPHTRPCQRH